MATTLRHEDGRLGIFTGDQVVGARKRGWNDIEGSTPEPPAESDRKGAWVDHAVARGMDRAEAAASTKADLVERFR